MGNFRVVINAVGGHGQDRDKGNGESPEFGEDTPEGIIKRCIAELQAKGNSVTEATVHHWPGQIVEVVDNLITGKRIGKF